MQRTVLGHLYGIERSAVKRVQASGKVGPNAVYQGCRHLWGSCCARCCMDGEHSHACARCACTHVWVGGKEEGRLTTCVTLR